MYISLCQIVVSRTIFGRFNRNKLKCKAFPGLCICQLSSASSDNYLWLDRSIRNTTNALVLHSGAGINCV